MRKLLYVVIAIIVLGVIGNLIKDDEQPMNQQQSQQVQAEQQIEYAEADINVLMSELKDNAALASKNYKGKNVKIINGVVTNIDSDARYINIDKSTNSLSLANIQVFTDEDQLKEQVLNLKKGMPITVYGKISDVGDLVGYSVKATKIEPLQ